MEDLKNDADYAKFLIHLHEEFLRFDIDKNQHISYDELRIALSRLKVAEKHQIYFLDKIDLDKSQTITWHEYYEFGISRYRKLRNLFDFFDANKDGKISLDEFANILSSKKIELPNRDNLAFFNKFDTNHDGFIDFTEFRRVLFFIPHLKNVEAIFTNVRDILAIMNDEDDEIPLQVLETTVQMSPWQTFLKSALSGGLSGAITKTVIAPMERIKILKQVSTGTPTSAVGILKNIWETQGARGLFKGNFAHILKASPEKALKFGLFEHLKDLVKTTGNKDELTNREIFACAAGSSGVAVVLLHPLEVIRTQMSVNPDIKSFRGTINHLLQGGVPPTKLSDGPDKIVPKVNPVSSFYRGLIPHLCTTVPNSGLNVLSYDLLKKLVFGKFPEAEPSTPALMAVGGASSLVSSVVFYPFHLLKSRLIMKSPEENFRSITTNIWNTQGFLGFFRGITISISKSIPSHAISVSTKS